MEFVRHNNRKDSELREITIQRHINKYAEGSALIAYGDTKVICTATVLEDLPRFLRGKEQGWLSAEYSMLPRATHTRSEREKAGSGKVNSRNYEISRLIGRSLRACIDLTKLGTRQIQIDCDVIQADGGTRTASITGAFVALSDAINHLINCGDLTVNPIKAYVAAVSVGIHHERFLLDLDYIEDSRCDIDLNLVMLEGGGIVEIQGSAERKTCSQELLNKLIDIGSIGINKLINMQKSCLETPLSQLL